MKLKYLIITIIIAFFISLEFVQAQNTTEYSDYRRSLKKNNTNAVESPGGLLSENSSCLIGREPGPIKYRAVYQFDIPDNIIPDGSQITKAVFTVTCTKNNHTTELYALFYNITYDMVSTENYDEMFAQMEVVNTDIGQAISSNNQLILNSNDPVNPYPAFKQAIQNSLVNNKFVLGIRWNNDGLTQSKTWYLNNFWMSLYIEYSIPNQTVTLDQRLSDNITQVGKLRKWEGTDFTPPPYINPGTSFVFPVNSIQTIQGDQAIYSNEKYNNWNGDKIDVKNHHGFPINTQTNTLTSKFEGTYSGGITIKNSIEGTGIDGGIIQFKDPWLIDYADPDYANTLRNQGMSAPFREQNSPFTPDFTSSYNGYVYKGVFLNQSGPGSNWQGSYYSISSPTEQTIPLNGNNHKFFFQSWTYDPNKISLQYPSSNQTGVVFKSSDQTTLTANLKGQLMSNSTSGISSNSQRKMVRTDDGIYHIVYESMGSVWYTISETTNFGGEWSEEYLVQENAKNPSIAYDGNNVQVVYEYYDPSVNSDAIIQKFNSEYLSTEDVVYYPATYYGSAKPVIAIGNGWQIVIYRKNSTEGLKERTKWLYLGSWFWGNEYQIPETDANSINPSIVVVLQNIHLVFESLNSIKYKTSYTAATSWRYNLAITLSTGSGFPYNNFPCISISNSDSAYVLVSWRGYSNNVAEKIVAKENAYSIKRNAVVAKAGLYTSWGGFSNFSNNVNFVNNNSLNTLPGSIITWSESNGQYSKFVRRNSDGTYGTITSLSTNGIQPLVSNGSGFDNIKAMVFNASTSAPYLLNKCTNDFSPIPLSKIGETETIDISYGRSGVVEKNGVEFLFSIGDVLLNDQTIKFVERIDTLPVPNLEELNSVARTESFNLNTQSELILSNYYYVVYGEKADSSLSDQFSVSFKCELVNSVTNQVVGTFDDVSYNKLNVQEYANPAYLIDCSGIETGNYYIRLTTSVNDSVNLFISDIQRDDIVLEKSSLLVRNFKGEGIPTTYDLAQNFPNPFNPSTTIRYQLPQDGMVTLRIYDILGSEVATLVNEEKVAGRYEVNFNASSLASGVYIYKIQAGNFINSKKMILLK